MDDLDQATRAQSAVPETKTLSSPRRGMGTALFKSSLVASAVFAAAWIRVPPTTMFIGDFLAFGIPISIFSMVLGFPLASLIERLKIGRWWSYLAVAAAMGALLGAMFSSHPVVCPGPARTGEQETCVENPFTITFSPWTRSQPLVVDNPPIQWSDYIGTIAFGAVAGGVLGISFWYFYSRRGKT
jgi:hypothetical protein